MANRARSECEKYQWQAVRSEWLRLYQQLAGVKAALVSRRVDAAQSL